MAQGDLATGKLTYLASQNKFGNVKPLETATAEPPVDPTKPLAEQEAEEQGAQTAAEPATPDGVANAMDNRIQDITSANIGNAAAETKKINGDAGNMSIFDWARRAQDNEEITL